jgi:PAB1-binding protein PBP1
MNKHVEKFARECGAWNQIYGNRMFMIDEHFDEAKFAELIVRECANISNQAEKQCQHPGTQILKHFGVEE